MSDINDKQTRAPEVDPYNFILQNVNLYSGLPLDYAAFDLSFDRMPGEKRRITCNREGLAEFTLSQVGQYKLEQIEARTGYEVIPNPIIINIQYTGAEVVGDQESDWYDYDNSTSTLTVKNSPELPTGPEPPAKPEQPPELPSDIIELSLKNTNEKGDLLRGAEFKLISPNAEERVINWDNIPLGSFPILRLNMQGEWKLEQTKAPLGYQFIPAPLLIRFAGAKVMVDGDETSDWFDYDSPSKTLTIKNAPIQSQPEGGTKMKVATDNSLKELIKLVKSQPSTSSGGILNVTLDYTIPSYSPVEVETKRKRVYADIPCVNSKVAMNAQITPNDNIENVSLLTYAEPFDGYIRCYFSEQPTESYIIDSVELTPVTSIVKKK